MKSILLISVLVLVSCRRHTIEVDVRRAVHRPYPFVANGSVMLTSGRQVTRWDFTVPLHPGSATIQRREHRGTVFEARMGMNRRGKTAWYAVEIHEGGRRSAFKADVVALP